MEWFAGELFQLVDDGVRGEGIGELFKELVDGCGETLQHKVDCAGSILDGSAEM